ncbi:hypothetical protein [Deinococcus radiophilus]|uniref:Uncharacterized protein n=2 Tax=Deinococcus TaxID=1298 RepID=A0A3S0RAG7_9DEIO|nr:hypothetical protein [Deinococcus radiophilus]RTR22108.1 hypothetical protein EJ104_12825 [Deinococcus radiophilus]
MTLSVKNAAPEQPLRVQVQAVGSLQMASQVVTLHPDATGSAQAVLNVSSREMASGTGTLTANTADHEVPAELTFSFKSETATVTSPAALRAAYPRLTGPNMGPGSTGLRPASLQPLTTQPQAVTVPLPQVAIVEDVQYLMPDGTLSAPMDGIQYAVPNTGSGTPSLEDQGDHAPNQNTLRAQYACGTQQTTVYFNHIVDGVQMPIPKGTYIRASEQNSLTDSIQAEGWIGDNGAFTFPMQICDTGNWFSRDAPDLYFILETRNSTGLTETHGTFARRHWWRTGTWWNTSPAAMQGLNVTVRGTNAEAELARRVWQKVNDVSNWHAQAMANDYGRFSVDVLYPASDYLGVATSRAAYKQIQLVYAHGTNDSVLFHEYGHEVYYRQLFGSTLYESYNTATSATYPTCGGCIGHSLEKDIGPEAAMIEGWADFFEAVTTDNVPNAASEGIAYWVEYPDRYPSVPTGPGSELRVASFLYDLYDADLEGYYNEWDDDALKPAGGPQQRFRNVAQYANNLPVSAEFKQMWFQNIKPTLDPNSLSVVCGILRSATLGSIDPACP